MQNKTIYEFAIEAHTNIDMIGCLHIQNGARILRCAIETTS